MLIDELKNQIEGDILTDDTTLKKYSTDASLFEVRPQIVIFPKNKEDIEKILKTVNKENENIGSGDKKYSVTIRSAGTCMAGGSLNDSIILDVTKYINKLEKPDVEKKEVYFEPGLYYRDFEKEMNKYGLMYPAFPASKDLCAMGGIIGNNGAGEKTLKYGKAENFIEELDTVLSDGSTATFKEISIDEARQKGEQDNLEGKIYKGILNIIENNEELIKSAKPKVSKNSAGYYIWNVLNREKNTFDMTKLIVGSQGTLAMATKAKMRLVDIPKEEGMLAVFFKNRSHLGQIVNLALKYDPESVEAYDDKTVKLALKFWTGFIKKKGLFGAAKLGLSFIPEMIEMIKGGVPTLVMLVNFTSDNKNEIKEKIDSLEYDLKAYKELTEKEALTKAKAAKYWTIRHDAFALLREHMKERRTAPFIDDVIVPPEVFPEFLPKLEALLDSYGLVYNIHGHAGNGNFHVIPLMDFHKKENVDVVLELGDKVYDLVLSYGGSITAEHNDGIIRTPYLKKQYSPEIISIFKEIKGIFDPQNVLNPGKKVDGDVETIRKYIKIEK
ncbi:FAD-binding oxidoreductase [Candidatus Nomurabacteria bacterium]|nr:FAD-binding oxidoreductase [Candidatus Nomurabacteria bacterium]